jgi:TolB-like protein/Tfp pilus assembly protein PilF
LSRFLPERAKKKACFCGAICLIYQFEDFSLDVGRQELRHGADRIDVEPQVLDLLQYIIRNRERVVSKDDLIEHVWHGRIVSDSTLTSRITAARRAVGDDGDHQRLIRTIARKGIRFVGDVRGDQSGATENTIPPVANAAAPQLPDKPSIAVLPFTNMSGDPEQEYFSDGITEDIISALSRLRWFFVIARNSAFVYKGHAVDVKQVGRDLGVRYVLEGSVRKSGQRVRISAQLIDASSDKHIWAERYDRELTDIFALQDEITTRVTAAIEPKLLAAEGARAQTRSTEDLDAWDMVARALSHYWKLTASENDIAIGILRDTARRYPNYAPAHSMLAFALLGAVHMGWFTSKDDRETATRLAHRAQELDDNDPWAYLALGYLALTARQTDESVRQFRAALDLNSNFAAAHGYLAWALSFDGRSDEAIEHANMAIRMSPRDPLNCIFFTSLAAAHYMNGRYDEAVTEIRQALQQRPSIMVAHRLLCASLAQAGHIGEARVAMQTLRQLQPDLTAAWVKETVPYTDKVMSHYIEGLRKAGVPE